MNKHVSGLIAALFLLCFTQFAAFAQNQNAGWTRIESENKEVSFAVPENLSFIFDKEGFNQPNPRNWSDFAELRKLRAVTAYENGVTMFFESYDVKNAQKAVPYMLSNFRDYKVNRIAFENFTGFELTSEKTHYAAFYYLASEKNIYLIGVGARRKDNESLSRFLNSVRLNNKPVFKISAGKTDEPDKTTSILDLRETPIEFGLLSKDEKKELESKSKEAKSDKKDDEEKDTDDKKGLIVLFKPRASYTDLARQNMEQGKVVFRVTFTAEGKVRKVSVVRNLKYGLTEEAFRAIRRIRFIPAEKDGTAIEATKTVEYSFTIY